MILYVNGDSHTAAAEAVNQHSWAMDDPELFYMGRAPHPANLAVSWGKLLSVPLRAGFHCEAQAGGSNARIMRVTRDWIKRNYPFKDRVLMIIQWSTWEREEWYNEDDDIWYQVNASGADTVPEKWAQRYKEYVVDIDWKKARKQAHDEIWAFHNELNDLAIPHIFFNGNTDFANIPETKRNDWGASYMDPYKAEMTYNALIRAQGIETVAPNSWHFGKDGHSFWSRFMLQYIIKNKFI